MSISTPPVGEHHTTDRTRSDSPRSQTHRRSAFKELMKTSAVTEEKKKKNLFTLIEEEKKEEDLEPTSLAAGNLTHPLTPLSSSGVEATRALPPTLEILFEKVASSMVIMHSNEEQETTFVLDNPNFASSPFFGTKITIKEYSTAPKAFNIEISSYPAALAQIAAHQGDLMAAFQNGRFNFSVHRLDTQLLDTDERPVFCREETQEQGSFEGRQQ